MSSRSQRAWGAFLVGSGSLAIIIAISILSWQVFNWLKYGAWFPVTLQLALGNFEISEPSFNWRGVKIIWETMEQWPVSLYLIGYSVIAIFIGGIFFEEATMTRHKEAAMREAMRRIREKEP